MGVAKREIETRQPLRSPPLLPWSPAASRLSAPSHSVSSANYTHWCGCATPKRSCSNSAQHDEAEDAHDLGALPGVPHRGPDWREGLRRQGIRPIGVRRSPLSTLAAAAPTAEASAAAAAPTAEASAAAAAPTAKASAAAAAPTAEASASAAAPTADAADAAGDAAGMPHRRNSQCWNLR